MTDKFRKELLEKLAQRITSNMSEEKCLLFALRHYDLDASGHTDLKQFRQFLTKFGIHHFSNEDSEKLFRMYDWDGQGRIEHKELINRILENKTTQITSPNRAPRESETQTKKVDRSRSKKRGMTGLLEIAYECHLADKKQDFFLDKTAFSHALHRCRLDIGQNEIDQVFDYFEQSANQGRIDYVSFLTSLKENGLNPTRKALVSDVFAKLDFKSQDVADLRVLASLFNSKNHFDVKGGRRTQDEIDHQFHEAVRIYDQLNNGSGQVDYYKFIDFWEYVSPSITKDADFESLTKHAFRYNELPNKGAKAGVDPSRFEQKSIRKYQGTSEGTGVSQDSARVTHLLESLRSHLSKGGPKKMIQFYQTLKHNDHDHDGKLACKEFTKSLNDLRVPLPDSEMNALFSAFDSRHSGFIDISNLMCSFVPELNSQRSKVVQDLLNALSSPTNPDVVLLSNIKKFYFPRGHVDFLRKKRPDYDIKEEFLGMLQTFLGLSGGANEVLPRDTVLQFFEMFSNAYSSDEEFCDILVGTFRMDKICTGSRVHSSHLGDNQSDYDAQSVVRSNLNHPYGTSQDMPNKSNVQRPQTGQSQHGGAPQNGFGQHQGARPQTGHQLNEVRGFETAPQQAGNHNRLQHAQVNGVQTPQRSAHSKHGSPSELGSPGDRRHQVHSPEDRDYRAANIDHDNQHRSGGYQPTVEDVRLSIIHQ